MKTSINVDDWRHELDRVLRRKGEDGQTTAEIAREMGVTQNRVRSMLAQLQTEGKLIRGFKFEEALDGSLRRRPVYRIKKEGKK